MTKVPLHQSEMRIGLNTTADSPTSGNVAVAVIIVLVLAAVIIYVWQTKKKENENK